MTRYALLLVALAGCYDLQAIGPLQPQNVVTDWRNEVVYQLLVDRFNNGDPNNDFTVDLAKPTAYHGGDWQGVINQLDYLQELGVTTIWISPVVQNVDSDAGIAGYHGYWAQDFTLPNPHFGDVAMLQNLSQAVHQRGMKLVLDIVTNHVGQLFYYDINKNGQPDELVQGSGTSSQLTRVSEYDPDYQSGGVRSFTSLGDAGPAPIIFFDDPTINRILPMPRALQSPDVYHKRGRVTDWNNDEQVQYGDFPGGLKDLMTEDDGVRQAMVDVYNRWAELADFDAFRIDTVKHVEHEFWQTFCQAMRDNAVARGKQNFVMFGEIFDGDDQKVGSYTQNGELDATVNFPAKYQVFDDVIKNNVQPTAKVQSFWESRAQNYPAFPADNGPALSPIDMPFNFLDNHDVSRFLSDAPSIESLEQALFVLMTFPGVPMIYYGTEQGFNGANDPSNREDLWNSNYDRNSRLYKWIKTLTGLRQSLEPLRLGGMTFYWTSTRQTGEDAGILAYTRDEPGQQVMIIVNTSNSGTSSTSYNGTPMSTPFPADTDLVDMIGGQIYTTDDNSALQIDVLARQNILLVLSNSAPSQQ